MHPLLREPMVLSGKPIPKIYLTTPQQLGGTGIWLCIEGFEECKPIPAMVLEAMDIVAQNNPQMEKGTENWLKMCLGLMSRYNTLGYTEFETIENGEVR